MEQKQKLIQPIEANVVKCQSWVLSKMGAIPTTRKDGEYKRKDGSTIKTVDVAFSNGTVFQVSASRFWKKA
jgi:hypothetical protein